MVKPAPTPFYIFQDFKNGATSLSFENFNGQTFLVAGSGNGICKILNLQTMKSNLELSCFPNGLDSFCFKNEEPVLKRFYFEGLDFQTSGNSVLKCGKWSNGVWAHVRMLGIHFWKLSSDFSVLEKCKCYSILFFEDVLEFVFSFHRIKLCWILCHLCF